MKWFNFQIKLLEPSTITGFLYTFVMFGPMIIPGMDVLMGMALRSGVLLTMMTQWYRENIIIKVINMINSLKNIK